MKGLDIVRRVMERLRNPAETAIAYQTVLNTVKEVVAQKKLDLAMSEQNTLAKVSPWFTSDSNDFEIAPKVGGGVLLPIRLERRGYNNADDAGCVVEIVNYHVAQNFRDGSASFYGDPLRLSLRLNADAVSAYEFRLVYEADFSDIFGLEKQIRLPEYFKAMVSLESAFRLLELVEDESPEWKGFLEMVMGGRNGGKWAVEIVDYRLQWEKYVKMFKGRATVPKNTYLSNRRNPVRTRYFR